MSTKHIRTTADLVRFDCAPKIDCGACGYGKTLDEFEVAGFAGQAAQARSANG